jgi:hypothetical protein
LVGLASWYISARIYWYILYESGIIDIIWMRRSENSSTFLYGRFGIIPFRQALHIGLADLQVPPQPAAWQYAAFRQ